MGTSCDTIGRYEYDEVTHSAEVASKLADVLDVSLDHLSSNTGTELDSATLGRIREISVMPEDDKSRYSLCSMHLSEITRQEKRMNNKQRSSIR